MADDKKLDAILDRLDAIDRVHVNGELTSSVDSMSGKLDDLSMAVSCNTIAVSGVKLVTDKTHKAIFGNGEVDKSLMHRFINIEKDFKKHLDNVAEIEEDKKEMNIKKDDRRWSIIQPLIIKAAEGLLFGGGVFGAFEAFAFIQSIIKP